MTHTQPLVRFTHVHAGLTLSNPDGSTREGKGRLIATLASQEMPDGTLAVAVSRCSSSDVPSRFRGRHIAEARLKRYLSSFTPQGVKPTQVEKLQREIEELLVFRMSKDNLVDRVIRPNLLRALASDEIGERMRAIGELKSIILP